MGLNVDTVGLVDYPNVPKVLGIAMSHVPLKDLDEHYSVEDMYDILEKAAVDAHNARLIHKANEREQKGRRK